MKQADFERAAQLQTQMRILKDEKDKLHRHSRYMIFGIDSDGHSYALTEIPSELLFEIRNYYKKQIDELTAEFEKL